MPLGDIKGTERDFRVDLWRYIIKTLLLNHLRHSGGDNPDVPRTATDFFEQGV